MHNRIYTICLIILIASGTIYSSGFQINEHGARAMAMAGAYTGLGNGPSAVYFNPAGITQLRGTHISAGVSLIAPSTTFTLPSSYPVGGQAGKEFSMEKQLFTPINFYFTQEITDQISIGLSVNNPFGLGTKWDDDWAGSYLAEETEIRTFFFNPVIAVKLSKSISVAAGINYAIGDVKIVRNASTPLAPGVYLPLGRTSLEGDAKSIGFNAALFVKPSDKFSFGISYRSENTFDFEGDANTNPTSVSVPVPGVGLVPLPTPSGGIKATLKTPQNLTAGLAFQPKENLTLTFDFQYVGWSSYDELKVEFTDYPADPLRDPTGPKSVQTAKRDYENSFILRAGGEYILDDNLALRGGVLFDNNPVKDEMLDPTLPDADRIGLNVGFGYKLSNNITLDVAYMFLLFTDRDITTSQVSDGNPGVQALSPGATFNGTYTNNAHLFGVNFSYAIK